MRTFILDTRIKTKANTSRIRIQSIIMAKTIFRIQHTEKNRSRKNEDKDGKTLYKLMSNTVYSKTMDNVRNRIDVKLVSDKKY